MPDLATIGVSFIFPAALWLLAVLIPLWWLTLSAPRRLSAPRFWGSLLLRTLMLAALVLGLAGAQVVRDVPDLTTVFVIDRSDSIAPEATARGDAFVRESLTSMRPDDRAAVVVFGENALVERTATDTPASDLLDAAPVSARTNIQQAVELGLSLFPADSNKRMVLLSDGGENAGDARKAAQLALTRGVSISYVDLGSIATGAGEVLVTGLEAPASARTGQMLDLVATVESSVALGARLRVFDGDQVVFEQDVALQAGPNTIPISVQAREPGFQRYRAEIVPQSDTQPKNNVAEALVQVAGPPTVLLVEGTPGEAQPFHAALAAAQVNAETVAPEALPADLATLGRYEAVVLVNVPANAVPPAAMTNLPLYVRDLGKGLVMVGGDKSYGIGGYGKTPIEDALPVYTDVRDQIEHPKVAIVYILDKSSSMQACHCRGPDRGTDGYYDPNARLKLDIGKDAVLQSVALLSPQDSVGVVTFAEDGWVPFEPQVDVSPEEVLGAIGPIAPDGHLSDIGRGMQKGLELLQQSDAKIKHAVLLTDGWGKGVDPMEMARQMRESGITLTVIADGTGSAPYLEELAATGGGRYIPVQNFEDVPEVYVDLVNQIAGNYTVETPFTPRYGASSPVLSGLDAGLPQLYGYNATTVKQTATTALYGVDEAPVLAQWQYGLGRTAAWTSDTKGQWAKDWISWPEFPRFAAQLVGWVLPSETNTSLRPELRSEGSQTIISATLPETSPQQDVAVSATIVGADGSRQEVPLARIGPGQYQAAVQNPPQGTYIVQLVGTQSGQVIAQATAGMAVPYSPEYRQGQSNTALLDRLAKETNGTRLEQPADAFEHNLEGAVRAQEIALPLVLFALILMPLDVMLRRLYAYQRRR